ncbi:MAG: hypothetical protein ACLQDM_15670 [Bradyrhizobium sp.]
MPRLRFASHHRHFSSCPDLIRASIDFRTQQEGALMAAYLISLALAFLVALALWEGLS